MLRSRLHAACHRHLVEDWRRGHRWLSTRLLLPAGCLDGLSLVLREEAPRCAPGLPHGLQLAAWVLLWGVLVARFLRQRP
jgi:hypothetical protein